MNTLTLKQLEDQYRALHKRYQHQDLSRDQFIKAARQLQAQDEFGNWWMIDAEKGQYLRFDGQTWQTADRPKTAPSHDQPKQQTSSSPPRKRGCTGCLSSPFMVGMMSFGTAAFWLIYSNIRAGQEAWDLITPLIMGGVPFALRVFQDKVDQVLKPLFEITTQFPFAMRTGAAFALPLVLGLVTSTVQGGGYGALRFTMLTSILGGYILTKKVK